MKHLTRISALVLTLAMVIGMLVVLPLSTAAAETADEADGVSALPAGAVAYDGTPSTSLAGSGTEADPYLIADAADLVYFRENESGAADTAVGATTTTYFKVTGDIYLNSESAPKNYALAVYNTKQSGGNPDALTFSGVLDGNGYTIYNMYGSGNGGDYPVALVYTLKGTIKNLNFDGVQLNSGAHYTTLASVAKKLNAGIIQNVHVKNMYTTYSWCNTIVGGIVGDVDIKSKIDNCTVSGNLRGYNSNVGGIVSSFVTNGAGANLKAEYVTPITNCVNNATLSSERGGNVGGILGYEDQNAGIKIENCINNGSVTGVANVGGIVGNMGRARSSVQITNCTNNGAVSGATAGGICNNDCGADWNSGVTTTVTNCINNGSVTGTAYAGGFSGVLRSTSAAYIGCINTGNVSAPVAGGLVGTMKQQDTKVTATNVVSTGNVTGTTAASGVVGNVAYKQGTNAALELTSVWMTATISTETGKLAVFSAGTDKADDTAFPVMTVADCGFDVTFVGGTAYSRIDATGAGHNDFDGNAAPAYTGTFAETALTTLNTTAKTKGYTRRCRT